MKQEDLRYVTLRLPVLPEDIQHYLLDLVHTILNPPSSSLRHMSVIVVGTYTLQDFGAHAVVWKMLVDALCKLPTLEMMTIQIEKVLPIGILSALMDDSDTM